MTIPAQLVDKLSIPAIAAPMFLVSGPQLVISSCLNGVVGTFPALNQRTTAGYEEWAAEITQTLTDSSCETPWGVNLIVHKTNPRVEADLEATVKHQVPVVITSLGAVSEVVDAVHSYGGLVFHDVIKMRHAEKAMEAGVDGLILVTAGAGGHAGTLHPFAFLAQAKAEFDTCLILSGSISSGAQILASRAAGADLAYMGTRFLATKESLAPDAYKQMCVDSSAEDIVYTPKISGIPANFLAQSLRNNGIDVTAAADPELDFGDGAESEAEAWKNVWSAGHGVSNVTEVVSVADLCQQLKQEYSDAAAQL